MNISVLQPIPDEDWNYPATVHLCFRSYGPVYPKKYESRGPGPRSSPVMDYYYKDHDIPWFNIKVYSCP